MNQQEIGAFIAKKRREQNLTQEQLAEKLNVSNKTVSKWETGKAMPDYSVIELLCKTLNISVSELLTAKENEQSDPKSFREEVESVILTQMKQNNTTTHSERHIVQSAKNGITFGSALAMVISYVHWHSIGWAIFHGLTSWGYVIYYLIKY